MPHPTLPPPARGERSDERGFAFPLALLGLIVVTLLVTTALLTSSTEFAMSQAHADAAVDLYAVDGAAQQYLGMKSAAAALSPPADSLHPVVEDAAVAGFRMSVTELQNSGIMKVAGNLVQDQTYSIMAEPAGRPGRKVSMMVRTQRTATPFKLNVTSGLTVGGNVKVTGSSVITDGRDAACDSAAAENALQVTAGSTISKGGAATIIGTADTSSITKAELQAHVLGDLSLPELSAMANVKFKAGEFSGRPKSYDSSGPRPRTNRYNWGCPAASADPCTTVVGNDGNMNYFPIVDIDAGGGTVSLQGNHGQGILIVRNGSLSIQGNFVYQGIILVERDLLVQGTGDGLKLEGAVVSFGENSTVDDLATGNSLIRFNRCSVASAENGANELLMTTAPQIFRGPAFAWTEVLQ